MTDPFESEKKKMIDSLFKEAVPDRNNKCTCGIIAIGGPDRGDYDPYTDEDETTSAKLVVGAMKEEGIKPLVLKSHAATLYNYAEAWSGYHLFVRFEKPTPVVEVRDILRAVVNVAGLSKAPKILP